jgi:hypothetical protein
LFTVKNMDPQVRMELLEAHCLLEKRTAMYHPSFSSNHPVKQWLYTWNMWSMVEGFAESMLKVMIDKIFEAKDKEKLT